MICTNCHREFQVRVPVKGTYLCSMDCYSEFRRKDYVRVQDSIDPYQLMRVEGGGGSEEEDLVEQR